MTAAVASPADLRDRLATTGYLCDEGLATIAYLTLALDRPLLLEGEPGTGKTALAEALAESLDLPLIRLQCFEGIDASRRSTTGTSLARSCTCARPRRRPAAPSTARTPAPPTSPSSSGRCTASSTSWPGRCCARCARARACCWSTRSTGPTASSRRSCWRCWPRTRSPSRSSGPSAPSSRRSWCSPPTGPVSCTTPSSGAASTTGSTTRVSTGSWRSCAAGRPRSARRSPTRSSTWCRSCARRRPAQAARRLGDPGVGPGPARPRAARARPRGRRAAVGAVAKHHDDAERVRRALRRLVPADGSSGP